MLPNNLNQVTPLLLTFNEEDNLPRTLQCLMDFKEVIVLDSGSTDATCSIARQFPNVSLHVRPFDNFKNQWNHGHSLTSTRWVLSLDADYQVSPELLNEITKLNLQNDAYVAAFVYYVYGKPLRGSIMPPRVILYQKDKCTYIQDGHTQRLQVTGNPIKLNHPIIHDDRKSLSRWLQSQQKYAADEWQKLSDPKARIEGADKLRMKTWLAPFLVFGYSLLVKGALLDGRRGIYYAFQRMHAELLLLLRRLDHSLKPNDPPSNS